MKFGALEKTMRIYKTGYEKSEIGNKLCSTHMSSTVLCTIFLPLFISFHPKCHSPLTLGNLKYCGGFLAQPRNLNIRN